jgi:hypothetical protein
LVGGWSANSIDGEHCVPLQAIHQVHEDSGRCVLIPSFSPTITYSLYTFRPDQIKRHIQSPTTQRHTYTLFLVPRVSTLATRILEEEGVLGEITVSAYNMQFIPLEEDVISLECEAAFKEIWVVSTTVPRRRLA